MSIGTPQLRKEDRRLLTGAGVFVGDVDLPGVLHVGYVTASVAHARLARVDVSAAREAPGIVDVVTNDDLSFGHLPPIARFVPDTMTRTVLASGTVRFVGEPIAAVVGETAALVEDALELVEVDYEPLDAVVRPEDAIEDGVLLFPDAGTNLVSSAKGGTEVMPWEDCEVVVTETIRNQRVAPCPLETRIAAAEWTPEGRLVFYASCQGAHPIRTQLAQLYGMEESQVRVITRDVGGSFGAKARAYPEDLLLPFLAKRAGRAVRWVPPRSLDMVGLGHSRAQVQTLKIGGRRDGTIVCLEAELLADSGAYPLMGPFMVTGTGALLPGPYRVPNVHWSSRAVVTNTTPIVAYRGAGRPESTALIDRAVDLFAREIEMDAAAVRRANLLRGDEQPWKSPTGLTYDSGDYAAVFDAALDAVGYDALRAEQARRRAAGDSKLLGVGTSVFIDRTGGMPGGEFGSVELLADGSLRALTGSSPYGQGHHTAWAQIIAERTGIPIERIEVVHGDTDVVPSGGITGGSRSVQKAGVALADASDKLVELARSRAADLLEAGPGDVVLDVGTGRFHVVGAPGAKTVGWVDVAATLDDGGDGLECVSDFPGGDATFPFGAYVAVVEVDADTGFVSVQRMLSIDDAGTIVNPMLAEGQVHGGMAQGIAQALFEEFLYDDDGNPLTSNFADYSFPTAADLPSFDSTLQETPSPNNPLGAKGIGESGTIGAPPAVQNAVIDALSHLGVRHIDLPVTAERVWRAMRGEEDRVVVRAPAAPAGAAGGMEDAGQ
jgi:carbon-monoxide dehydrogenase large subunit